MIQRFGDGRDWFFKKRLGMFIHWGVYAIPAWHEQIQYRRHMLREEYEKLMGVFNPKAFDPNAWLDLAEEVGMEYFCFTTKHVDGFCLWDTRQTSFNVMNSPYGKDILAMLAEACRERGFPLCLYYSLADMNHRNYPSYGQSYERAVPEAGDAPDREKYLAFVAAQLRELCSNYGPIAGIWWDANQIGFDDPRMNAMIRELQPGAAINARGGDPGDFDLAERDHVNATLDAVKTFARPMEGCQALGVESWGYKTDEDYFSHLYLTQCVDKIMAKGGNYLLNVGPDARGQIPSRQKTVLKRFGKWYASVREAIIDTEPIVGLTDNPNILLTRAGNVLYAHAVSLSSTDRLLLENVDTPPAKVTLLNTGKPLKFGVDRLPTRYKQEKPCLRIRGLPVDRLNEVMVIKMEFPGTIESVRQKS